MDRAVNHTGKKGAAQQNGHQYHRCNDQDVASQLIYLAKQGHVIHIADKYPAQAIGFDVKQAVSGPVKLCFDYTPAGIRLQNAVHRL
ncbi:hypothetical protein D3C71_1838430 [compost metagenome]